MRLAPSADLQMRPPGMELAWPPGRGFFCPHCQQRSVPIPYFSRGFNLAKGVVLLAFSPVAPLLFFLWRRDRVLCSWCKSILPGEVSVPLLEAFTAAPPVGLLEPSSPGALELGSDAAELARTNEATRYEIAVHEHKSKRSARRARTLGVLAFGVGSLGVFAFVDEGIEPASVFFSMSGLSGVGAFASNRRANRHRMAAEAKRQRQRVLEILAMAKGAGGKLTVTQVAAQMRIDLKEAEALLDGMVDGRRVDVHVDEGGRLTYVFPELTG